MSLVGPFANAQTSQSATQTLLESAHTLETRGRMDLAAQRWKQVLLADPNNAEALGGLARAAKQSGDNAAANVYIERLRAVNPNDPGITRAETTSTTAEHTRQLQQAGKLAQGGQYGQAMVIYRQLYGANPPAGDIALAYYETESATEDGRPHAIAGLRQLIAKSPGEARYQIALGRILTYNPKTRAEGRKLLSAHPNDPQAVEALRQSLIWDEKNPATAGEIREYLSRHPDAQLADALKNEPKATPSAPLTEAQRAAAAVNATRTAEDREAYRELNAKHLEAAEECFKAILAKNPDEANALAGMGYLRMQQANFAGAISFLAQAKQNGSKDPGLEAALATSRFWNTAGEGALALNAGNLSEAEKDYRAALQLRPASPEALEGLGGTLLKAEQPEAAIPVFAQFVKVKPSAAHAWRGLFLAQFGAGDATEALSTSRQIPAAARAELAKDPLYLRSLASALASAGREADAEQVLKSALDLPFPTDADGLQADTKLQFAALLQQANHLDQAAGLYREVLLKDQTSTGAWQGLVRVEHAQGNDSEAERALESMPPDVYAKAMADSGFDSTVASVYQATGRLEVAQEILEKSLEQQAASGSKPSVASEVQLAGIYLQQGDVDAAYPIYQQVLKASPDRLDAWKGMLDALHSTGHDAEALAEVQQIPVATRTQLEADVAYLQTLGAIYNGLGQGREAQRLMARVQEHYAAMHTAPPADVEIQAAWLMYNGGNEAALYRQLMALGGRNDLSAGQRRTVQTIWASWAVRRANQAALDGKTQRSVAILTATSHAFPNNLAVTKALAGGYSQAGMSKQALGIWKSFDMSAAPPADYKAAIGAALAADDMKDAETWLRFGLNAYPRDGQMLVLAAKFEQARGDANRAAEYYKASLKAMPETDPGAELSGELSRPGSADVLSSGRAVQDLSAMLAPGTSDDRRRPEQSVQQGESESPQPYLPGGGYGGSLPVQLAPRRGEAQPADQSLKTATPGGSRATQNGGQRLRDYVPQASLNLPVAGDFDALGLGAEQPALSVGEFRREQIVRLTAQAVAFVRGDTEDVPDAGTEACELAQGVSFRHAGFFAPPPSQSAGASTLLHAGPLTAAPNDPQIGGQSAQQAATPATSGDVYGPYVPYTGPKPAGSAPAKPAARSTGWVQHAAVPQSAAPSAAQSAPRSTSQSAPQSTSHLAPQPTRQNAAGEVYGPYVPYVPPAPARSSAVPQGGGMQPPSAYPAASGGGAPASPGTSQSSAVQERAAAMRRRRAGQAPILGQSRPPAESYSTPPTEAVQYNSGAQQTAQPGAQGSLPAQRTTGPVTEAPVYRQPAQPLNTTQGQAGDSYGQQYPQPGTATHRRARSQHAETPAAPTQAQPPLRYPAIEPGTGQIVGEQPASVAPAYPLPAPPTDGDLIQKQLPPLRGSYSAAQVPMPTVPLTDRQRAERDLATLEASYSGWLGGTGGVRYRSGVAGYDRLADLESTFEASFVAGNNVRFSIVPRAVFLNSGQFDLTAYTGVAGSPVIGTFNSATAAANPQQQSASGIGGEIQATGRNFSLALGYTPYEFLVENVTGRALFKPDPHFTLFATREAVTETQLSYAGLRDPGTANAVYGGNIWGGVVSTGGGIRYEAGNERAGFYLTGDGASLNGYHVLANTKVEGSAGAYFLAHSFPGYGTLNIGVSAFGMHYAQNERPLSYGLGGYFSPTAYFLASVPISFTGRYKTNFHYTLNGSVGAQTFQEASQLYFPLDRGVESGFQTGQACTVAQVANRSCGAYPVNTNTGGNYSFNSEGTYRIVDHWFAGGFLSANNTNNYNTVTAGFFVRYLFRPQFANENYPTGLFPVDGLRPLRVP